MAANPQYLWHNGGLVKWEDANIHLTDLAWGAVGAVFEGIRAYSAEDGEGLNVFRLREHMQRLRDSSRMVRLPIDWSVDELVGFTLDLLRANEIHEDTYIFPLVYSGGDPSKRNDPASLKAAMYIRTNPSPTHLCTNKTQRAKVSSWTRISDNVMPPRIKNISNYRNGHLALHEVKMDGYDCAVLLNPQGKVAEAPGACITLVRNGKLVTPDVTSGILESITRDAVITMAKDMGMEVEERTVDRTELYTADELFLCGTAFEITSLVEIDRYTVGNGDMGDVTRQLERKLLDTFRGSDTTYAEWNTPVYTGQ
jgi:branched-chain amino acid aminotransferase